METDFSPALTRSLRIREIYHQLEKRNHGSPWTMGEDMIGLVSDIGELGRMVMSAEGRWVYPGDLSKELPDKLSECLWWLFVLSSRLGIDLNTAFSAKLGELEQSLSASLKKGSGGESPTVGSMSDPASV